MCTKRWPLLSILTTAIILASATVILLTEFEKAQAQVNASSLTPEQKAAICDPNNPSSRLNPVNTTESRICGIPVTVKPSNATTTSSNMTTGGEAPPSSTSSSSPPPPTTSIAPSTTPHS
jgi:cell division protein FtsN